MSARSASSAELVLGLDTATSDTCVAICRSGGELLSGRRIGPDETGRPSASRSLLVAVEEVVAEAGGWERVGLIGVGVGPGSFTGQRIGISTARALAQGRGLALAGVSTTEALALGIETEEPGVVPVGVVDARRGELFAERLGATRRGAGPVLCKPEGLAAAIGVDRAVAVGEGALRFQPALEAQGLRIPPDSDRSHHLDAANVCRLAELSGGGDPSAVVPIYLRRPDADKWIQRNRGDQNTQP